MIDCSFILSEWIKIEGSNVINLDIPATNGVVQVLESVIQVNIPKNPSIIYFSKID